MQLETLASLFEDWNQNVRPGVVDQYGADDADALAQSWGNYTDSACSEGRITNVQYRFCPGDDAPMPKSKHLLDDLDWLLGELDIDDIDGDAIEDRLLEDDDDPQFPELASVRADWREELLELARQNI